MRTYVREMPSPLLWMHEAMWLGIAALAEEQLAHILPRRRTIISRPASISRKRPGRPDRDRAELARLRLERRTL